jgi:hypothetical protein
METRSNREKERQMYYTLLQLVQGGHPPPCSTMYYGQVQKRHWTQVPDTREAAVWSTTLVWDKT